MARGDHAAAVGRLLDSVRQHARGDEPHVPHDDPALDEALDQIVLQGVGAEAVIVPDEHLRVGLAAHFDVIGRGFAPGEIRHGVGEILAVDAAEVLH